MSFVVDPAIKTKIARMKERVRWQHPVFKQLQVDQTRIAIEDRNPESSPDAAFSFLVIGDSGTSRHITDPPQRRITKQLLKHSDSCEFILHTGDVVYLVGSSEQYPDNFIKPYREFLVGGHTPNKVQFDKMTFKLPFLPVLGNHDYYDLPLLSGILSKALSPIRKLLRRRINLDIGWHGSYQGEAFAKAFLDYTYQLSDRQLQKHIEAHYPPVNQNVSALTNRCLRYVPGEFTKLPNRYYTFRKNGIDFFALDSNTFNSPQPLSRDPKGQAIREKLEKERDRLEENMRSFTAQTLTLNTDIPKQAAEASSIYGKMEQLEEQIQDIDKQLNISPQEATVDTEQLTWLRDRLIASWQDPTAKGRILFFHHPPYVSESTKWAQGQTLAVRARLREVLDQVQLAISEYSRPLVDLVLNGHAHCFEYIKTVETGHGDRTIPWVVCGGSGFSLRRQRKEGSVLEEFGQPVAESQLFIGRSGQGNNKRRPYSGLRIDITYIGENEEKKPQFTLRPLIAERYQGKWKSYEMPPILVNAE
ncbi:MAG: metallophosphoesterase [Cyanobacteria bacterium P01_C01_bin.69]